jgi:large subunit ribosomal protein L4
LEINGKKVLLLTSGTLASVYKSGRNIPKVKILEANKASTYDILNNQVLLIQKSALDVVQSSFAKKEKVVS